MFVFLRLDSGNTRAQAYSTFLPLMRNRPKSLRRRRFTEESTSLPVTLSNAMPPSGSKSHGSPLGPCGLRPVARLSRSTLVALVDAWRRCTLVSLSCFSGFWHCSLSLSHWPQRRLSRDNSITNALLRVSRWALSRLSFNALCSPALKVHCSFRGSLAVLSDERRAALIHGLPSAVLTARDGALLKHSLHNSGKGASARRRPTRAQLATAAAATDGPMTAETRGTRETRRGPLSGLLRDHRAAPLLG